jgi:hypothetical protein
MGCWSTGKLTKALDVSSIGCSLMPNTHVMGQT